jgi:hypothetical protein
LLTDVAPDATKSISWKAARDDAPCADLGQAMAGIPERVERGFTRVCVKPSQFTDDPHGVAGLYRDVVRRVGRW